MLSWLLDKSKPAPPQWMKKLLATEVGLLRDIRPIDGGSILTDILETTPDDTQIEAKIHKHLHGRLWQHFDAKDFRVDLEVTYFRPPHPELVIKFWLTEGDWIHPPVRARFSLKFGPTELTDSN